MTETKSSKDCIQKERPNILRSIIRENKTGSVIKFKFSAMIMTSDFLGIR